MILHLFLIDELRRREEERVERSRRDAEERGWTLGKGGRWVLKRRSRSIKEPSVFARKRIKLSDYDYEIGERRDGRGSLEKANGEGSSSEFSSLSSENRPLPGIDEILRSTSQVTSNKVPRSSRFSHLDETRIPIVPPFPRVSSGTSPPSGKYLTPILQPTSVTTTSASRTELPFPSISDHSSLPNRRFFWTGTLHLPRPGLPRSWMENQHDILTTDSTFTVDLPLLRPPLPPLWTGSSRLSPHSQLLSVSVKSFQSSQFPFPLVSPLVSPSASSSSSPSSGRPLDHSKDDNGERSEMLDRTMNDRGLDEEGDVVNSDDGWSDRSSCTADDDLEGNGMEGIMRDEIRFWGNLGAGRS